MPPKPQDGTFSASLILKIRRILRISAEIAPIPSAAPRYFVTYATSGSDEGTALRD